MENVYWSGLEQLDMGNSLVLITILEASGSTPRGAGTAMIFREDGTWSGTVGGGQVEYEALQLARGVYNTHQSITQEFDLGVGAKDGASTSLDQEAANLGMICGGHVKIEFLYIDAKDPGSKLKMRALWEQDKKQKPRVYIFGGGHVAQATVPVLASAGFRCVVADDRAEFANKELFPYAEDVYQIDFNRIDEKIKVQHDDYVVVMTRGHEHDYQVQAHALRGDPKYLGVMGSRHKIAFVTKRLLEDGFTKEQIQRCHMPIGLPIGGDTPEEIAISIAAELISCRYGEKTDKAETTSAG